MLDIQFIRDNRDKVQQKANEKGIKVDINHLMELQDQHGPLLREVEALRSKRNQLAKSQTGRPPEQSVIEEGKNLKQLLGQKEETLHKIEDELDSLRRDVPNLHADDTPLGGEEANRQEKTWGEPKQERVKDHLEWGEARGLIDFERGAKVAGNKFYFLKGPLVELELAVFQVGLRLAIRHGFMPMTVPHMVNDWVARGTGFLPRGEERQIYKIEGQDLNLIATAEIPITGYHADEILDGAKLPLQYAGLSPAYRVEAGAYGKHSKGLYRVHQFNKLELYVFCKPEDSEQWQQKLLAVEEELCQMLDIPYRVVRIAAGDLGAPAYKKFDVEYWGPADQAYHELMSCSNVTDYQARRLNIRYRDDQGSVRLVHSLNATAAAFSRMAIALIENHQTADGKVRIPEVLRPYMNHQTEI